jgi:cytochrome c peroxidase
MRSTVGIAGALLLLAAVVRGAPAPAAGGASEIANPHPVKLVRPPVSPLSAMAELGRLVFFDTSLSSSGQMSCASCHNPAYDYGPPNDAPVMNGGPNLTREGVRAVPSLRYLERQPSFSIGPDSGEDETSSLTQMLSAATGAARAVKTATDTAAAAANLVPQGGLFWDGRADTLQAQAMVPLLNPLEMDGGSVARVATKIRSAPYASRFVQLFGPAVLQEPAMLVSEAMFAVARYQIEDPSFHPYSSKFDAWLEGKARFTAEEMRGYKLFNDPKKADCAGCHLDQPSPDGRPPLFTDHQFEALGAPRNLALRVNRDPTYYDLGICGPIRTDLRTDTQYCGMFGTPTLRNVAHRKVFFHNGVFRSLQQVLDFYDFRDVDPGRVYSHGVPDDMPTEYLKNLDMVDPPFGRKPGEAPAMSAKDERDIIAFLQTLTDGYQPPKTNIGQAATKRAAAVAPQQRQLASGR